MQAPAGTEPAADVSPAGPAGLGPYIVDGKQWKVEVCLDNYFVMLNEKEKFPYHNVITYEALGKLAPDGSSVMIVCTDSTILKYKKGSAYAVGFAVGSSPVMASVLILQFTNSKLNGIDINAVVPQPNALLAPAHIAKTAKILMEQRERSWRSSQPRRSATTVPLENSEEPEPAPAPEPEPQVAQKKRKQPPAKAPTAAEKASKARKSKPSQQQKSQNKSNVSKPPVACKESGGDCGDYWGDYDYDVARDDDDEEEVVVVSLNTKYKMRKAREYVARKEKAQAQAHKDPPLAACAFVNSYLS